MCANAQSAGVSAVIREIAGIALAATLAMALSAGIVQAQGFPSRFLWYVPNAVRGCT